MTGSDEIVDRFMMQIANDSTLNTLYNTSGSVALVTYAEAWLLYSIDEFARVCTEDLTYIRSSGSSVGYFTADLTQRSINILAKVMIKHWLQQQVNNKTAFDRYFVDREFRMSAPMLPAMKSYLIEIIESIDKLLGDYAWDKDVNWDSWKNQQFDVFNN